MRHEEEAHRAEQAETDKADLQAEKAYLQGEAERLTAAKSAVERECKGLRAKNETAYEVLAESQSQVGQLPLQYSC